MLTVAPANHRSTWTWVAGVEVVLAAAAVVLDLALPALVIVLLAGGSLALRHQGPADLGMVRSSRPHLVLGTAVFAAVWSLFQLSVTMPITSHLSGQEQDVGVFEDVQGTSPCWSSCSSSAGRWARWWRRRRSVASS